MPKIAPDVLRKMAKSFPNEDAQVKLQILNLAVKLCLCNPKQTKLLAQYVFNLAKYDMNYDIRDRARFMRGFIFSENKLSKYAKKIFLAPKPAPFTESKFYNRQNYQLGSMSHYLNTKVCGYQDLPDFPEEAPDSTVRNVEPPKGIAQKIRIKKSFLFFAFSSSQSLGKNCGGQQSQKESRKS